MQTASSINYDFNYSWDGEADNAATVISHPKRPDYSYKYIIVNNLAKASKSSKTDPIICQIILFPSSESPFDKIDEIHIGDDHIDKIDEIYIDDDHKALSMIKNIPKFLNLEYTQRIANRLQYLYDVSKEDDPDEVAIAPESIKYFLEFIELEKRLKYPDIVLTPSSNIRAEWRIGPDQHFAVEFLPTGDAFFVVFAPVPGHPNKVARASGKMPIGSIMDFVVIPYGVFSWALQ